MNQPAPPEGLPQTVEPQTTVTLAIVAIGALLAALVAMSVVVLVVVRQSRRSSPPGRTPPIAPVPAPMPVPAPIPTDPLVAVIAGQDRQQIQLDRVREDVALLSDAARYQLAETLAHDSDLRQIVQLLGGVERPRRPVSARRRPSPPLPGDPR